MWLNITLCSVVMLCLHMYLQKVNGSPFMTNDAGFALAYAVIMLNTDQHNHNVRKQNIPMTVEVSYSTVPAKLASVSPLALACSHIQRTQGQQLVLPGGGRNLRRSTGAGEPAVCLGLSALFSLSLIDSG